MLEPAEYIQGTGAMKTAKHHILSGKSHSVWNIPFCLENLSLSGKSHSVRKISFCLKNLILSEKSQSV